MSIARIPVAAVMILPAFAVADISQGVAPSPGGFLQAGAFETTCGCFLAPGDDLSRFSSTQNYVEQAFLPGGEPSLTASRSTADVSITAAGSAGFGFVRGTASRYSPDTGWFAAGVVNGGWNEGFTVSHPARAGQPGVLVFETRMRASLHARDLTGSALCEVTVFKDRAQIAVNGLFDPGNADVTFGSTQWVSWGVAAYGLGGEDRDVDGVVRFAVPFTFGQPFRLGVYAVGMATQRSSGGFGGTWSSCSLDFTPGLTWNGLAGVYAEGSPISGATVTTESGTDWSQPLGGCPADVNADGFLDFFDYSDFVSDFETGGPTADFNGDGFVDFFDYNDFVGAFETGC